MQNNKSLVLTIMIIAIGMTLRVAQPLADAPADLSWSGGYYADEGFWTQDARNLLVLGKYADDEWHDRWVSPFMHYWTLVIYRFFGVGLLQTRIWSFVFAFLTLLYLAALQHCLPGSAWSLLIASLCPILIAYQRLALLESASILFGLIVFSCWLNALKNNSFHLDFILGFFLAIAYLTKGTQFFLIPLIVASNFVFLGFTKRAFEKLLIQFGGFVCIFLPYYFIIFIPHEATILKYANYYSLQQSKELGSIVKNIVFQPIYFYFNRIPIVFILSWLTLGRFILFGWRDTLKKTPIIGFCSLWLLAGYAFFSPFHYRPLRYYIPLLIPMIILAANEIEVWFGYDKPNARWVSGWRRGCWIGWMIVPLAANAIVLLDHHFVQDKALGVGILPGFSVYGAFLTCIVSIFCLFLRTHIVARMKPILILMFLLLDVGLTFHWRFNQQYHVYNTSIDLKKILPAGSVIAGQWAPELCLENNHRSIPMWKNFVNDSDPFKQYGVTHIISWEYPWGNELKLQKEWFPEEMNSTILIKAYSIKNTRVSLWKFTQKD